MKYQICAVRMLSGAMLLPACEVDPKFPNVGNTREEIPGCFFGDHVGQSHNGLWI